MFFDHINNGMTGSSKMDLSVVISQLKSIPFRKTYLWRARWADAAAGQRPAQCGWSFAAS